jgi:hypothetical protein
MKRKEAETSKLKKELDKARGVAKRKQCIENMEMP